MSAAVQNATDSQARLASLPQTKRVVLLSGHYYGSKRRAGFHWLADAFWRAGFEVLFVTTQISWISWLRRDRRFEYPVFGESRRVVRQRERFQSYVWFTPWHPADLRSGTLNRLTAPLARKYGDLELGPVEGLLKTAAMFVFESDLGLFLYPRLRQLAPAARFVYRSSDDLRYMKNHPAVLDLEERIVPEFDLVSSPSAVTLERFGCYPNVALHYHGVQKELFDACERSPYDSGMVNAVYAGVWKVDRDYLKRASRLLPDVRFHIIGPIGDIPDAPNIINYGERPFRETIPYLKFADVGLQPMLPRPGAEWFTDSLKVLQYTYCRLPIIAPDFLRSRRSNVFAYTPAHDQSIVDSMGNALRFDRRSIDTSDILSWDELAAILAGNIHAH